MSGSRISFEGPGKNSDEGKMVWDHFLCTHLSPSPGQYPNFARLLHQDQEKGRVSIIEAQDEVTGSTQVQALMTPRALSAGIRLHLCLSVILSKLPWWLRG